MSLFEHHPPRSICVLRLSAIGDVCHAIAAVQAIQRQWPDCQVTWIAGTIECKLLQYLPDICLIPFDKKSGWSGYRSVWRQLEGQRFDALLHMQAALRASVLSLGIKATHRLGFDKMRSKDAQGLFSNVRVPSPESPHVLDGFMAFAHTLGTKPQPPLWSLPLPESERNWAKQQITNKTLLICPAASQHYKNWSAEGYAALAEHAARRGFTVMLCGGPTPHEQALAQQIESLAQTTLTNRVGQTSLGQLMALIEKASLVLAPDTGPLHMATVAGTPALGLYAHHNPERTGPYRDREFVVSVYQPLIEKMTGKTIADLPWRTRLKDEQAMQQISIETVKESFNRLLSHYQLDENNHV